MPAALALVIPSSCRSLRRLVSNSLNTPRRRLPAAVLVSIGCSVAFSAAPLALIVWTMSCRSPMLREAPRRHYRRSGRASGAKTPTRRQPIDPCEPSGRHRYRPELGDPTGRAGCDVIRGERKSGAATAGGFAMDRRQGLSRRHSGKATTRRGNAGRCGLFPRWPAARCRVRRLRSAAGGRVPRMGSAGYAGRAQSGGKHAAQLDGTARRRVPQ
jgi:hypothetical protein